MIKTKAKAKAKQAKPKPRVRTAAKSSKPKTPSKSQHDRDAAAFYDWLYLKLACNEALVWVRGKTVQEAWEQCRRVDWLIWLASRLKMTKLSCGCPRCYSGGAASVRREMKLPQEFPWEKLKNK